MGKVIVLGATPNPRRHSNKAIKSLVRHDYEVVAVGFRSGFIDDVEILTGMPEISDVDTVLLYMGEKRQKEYYGYLENLNPRRVIFNPGTNNPELKSILKKKGIETVEDCALIMLNSYLF